MVQASFDFGNIGALQTLRNSFNVNVLAGLNTFAFQIIRPFTSGSPGETPSGYYDDLHISGGPVAVPVPAGIVMSSIGILAIGGFTWIRHRKVKLA